MPSEVADLKDDLVAFYGAGQERKETLISRRVFAQILHFYRTRVNELERVQQGCAGCGHYRLNRCERWDDAVPTSFQATGCDEWQWDQIPL